MTTPEIVEKTTTGPETVHTTVRDPDPIDLHDYRWPTTAPTQTAGHNGFFSLTGPPRPNADKTILPDGPRLTKDEIFALLETSDTIDVWEMEGIVLSALQHSFEDQSGSERDLIMTVDLTAMDDQTKRTLLALNDGELGYKRGPEVDYLSLSRSGMVKELKQVVQALRAVGVDAFGLVTSSISTGKEPGWFLFYKPQSNAAQQAA
ncbi:hypothetical protein OAO01_00290 [Oligoflexia bacterium]|nr:hypothetical protein [Oligoflexia bacterium]